MISVIIPLYNVENYIIKCMDSFEKQIYKDFELIVINDGSKDNSASVVEDYIQKSSMQIKLISQENAGVSAARNKGLDEASGEYICFVDADDMVGAEYLSRMIEIIINEEGCDLVICGSKSVPEDWDLSGYTYKEYHVERMNSYKAMRKFLYHDIVSGVWSLMVKKKVVEVNQLRFAEGYRYSEDLEMVWKMIAHSNTVAHIRDQMYIYRTRNDSVMSVVDDKRLDGFKLMKNLEKYLQKVRLDFSEEFIRYGTARWVWATLWQIALASDSYKSFFVSANKFDARNNMKKLFTYPRTRVVISSFIYFLSPFLYYCAMRRTLLRKIRMKKLNNRTFSRH